MSSDVSGDFPGTSRFEIVRRLGSGGFGTVFEAFDRERNSLVALKTLKRAEPEALYRFKHEFRALTDLAHPNLVSLYELMSAEQVWFFTMELVRGVNFLDYVRNTTPRPRDSPGGSGGSWGEDLTVTAPAPESGFLLIPSTERAPEMARLRAGLRQLAEGLRALHDSGRLHRDIKPSNVLVTLDGQVKILDFGLVTELGPLQPPEGPQIVGTPAYMAPEQAATVPVSEAADWYSVGVLLFEALTGRLPFSGSALEMLALKQVSEPSEARRFSPETPEDLNALCRDLLRLAPGARPRGAQIMARLAGAGLLPEARISKPTPTVSLVGRRKHLDSLREALRQSRDHAVTVLVEGRSGMGKSAMLHSFFQEIRIEEPRAVALSGRCYQQESVPYKALDSLMDGLSQYLKALPPRESETLLPREGLALARVFPVLLQVPAVAGAGRKVLEIPDSRELRRRAFAALRELLSRIASSRPLILAIDDLQWGDLDSALLLAELLRPPNPPHLLLIASYRSEDAESSPVLQTVSSRALLSGTDVRKLAVEELEPPDARALARMLLEERASPSADADALAREAGGNPYFIQELARSAPADTHPGARPERSEAFATSLDMLIHRRVSRLPEESRRLLEVISVAGAPVERGVAKRAAGLEEEEQTALGRLKVGRLVRATGAPGREEIETYHDRIREAVLAHLEAQGLRSHHLSLAATMEATGTADPERLFVHFQAAGDLGRAARYAVEAAARASAALAFDRAARLYRLALDLRAPDEPESSRLHEKLGDTLGNAGRGAEAAQAYLAAARGAERPKALELQRRAAEQFLRAGHLDEGLATIRTVLEEVGMKLSKTPRQALARLMALRLAIKLRGLRFRERSQERVSARQLMRIDTCWSVSIGLGFVDTMRGAVFQSRGLLLALKAGEPYRVVRALAVEAAYSSSAGGAARQRTEKLARTALNLARRLNDPHSLGLAAAAAGIAAYFEGRWRDARELLERGEGILREQCTGVAFELDNAVYCSLFSLFFLGEVGQLRARLPALLKDADERGDLYSATNLRVRVAYLAHLAAGEVEEAERELAGAIEKWSHRGFHNQHWWDLLGRAQIRLYSGENLAAWDLLMERWPALSRSLVLRIQLIFILSRHLRARCALAAVSSGRPRDALLRLAESDARSIEGERMPWADPLARLLQAGVASFEGDAGRAIARLASAETGFEAAAMMLHAAAARRRRGEIIGGEDGNALVEAADAWMSAQGITSAPRLAAMLAPGNWTGIP